MFRSASPSSTTSSLTHSSRGQHSHPEATNNSLPHSHTHQHQSMCEFVDLSTVAEVTKVLYSHTHTHTHSATGVSGGVGVWSLKAEKTKLEREKARLLVLRGEWLMQPLTHSLTHSLSYLSLSIPLHPPHLLPHSLTHSLILLQTYSLHSSHCLDFWYFPTPSHAPLSHAFKHSAYSIRELWLFLQLWIYDHWWRGSWDLTVEWCD